jgi:hypothetical protein
MPCFRCFEFEPIANGLLFFHIYKDFVNLIRRCCVKNSKKFIGKDPHEGRKGEEMVQTYVVFFFLALFVMAMLLLIWKDFFGADTQAHFTQAATPDFGNQVASQTFDAVPEVESRMRQVLPTDFVCQMGILPVGALTQDD